MALKTGIAGCGIGGLAAALLLRRHGHEITLFDKFDAPAPIGSGLVIQPVGLAVLDSLGLGDTVRQQGHAIFNMSGTESASGRSVLNVDYGPEGGRVFGLGIHRASLFDTLYQAAKQRGTTIISGQNVTSSSVKSDGRYVLSNDDSEYGPFDLVIDASGANSPLSPIESRPLPYGAIWGTVDWPTESPLPKNRLSQCYRQAKHMLGVLSLGILPGGTTEKTAIFWSEKTQTLPEWKDGDLNLWKQRTIDLWPEFRPFVEQITSHDQMTEATYRHGTLWRPYDNRLVFIGDSAHQASPQLGQGANMALLDAQALSNALEHDTNLETALKVYARKRRWHVQLYQQFSAVFTPFYQSDSRALPILRDYIMSPLSQVWPVKAMLTKLVCGNLIKPQ